MPTTNKLIINVLFQVHKARIVWKTIPSESSLFLYTIGECISGYLEMKVGIYLYFVKHPLFLFFVCLFGFFFKPVEHKRSLKEARLGHQKVAQLLLLPLVACPPSSLYLSVHLFFDA